MGTTASRGRAATPFAVLALLLGLLAMHGLASTHHAAAASSATHDARAVTTPAEDGHPHAVVVADVPAAFTSPAAPCDADCTALAVLCVAVLTGAALALLLARRRRCPQRIASHRSRAPGAAPPARHARGPDPVRELCVSRT